MTKWPGGSGGLGMSEGAEGPAALRGQGGPGVKGVGVVCVRGWGGGLSTGQPLASEPVDLIGQKNVSSG